LVSVLGLCGAVVGTAIIKWNMPASVAICIAILAGALCGLFNGASISKMEAAIFHSYLGMLENGTWRGSRAFRFADAKSRE
jgi:ribose/xylose/arabinose/galactoside ABC-type transport system permease subunit